MLSSIPTNIITGFLGVGKSSAISHLLKNKPSDERWAVLVNEFGEIGVDGSLFAGRHNQEQGIFIREVPGGCMCCTADLPMQVALNELLRTAKPDRLLIEPTGLGHPKEVLQALTSDLYSEVIDLQKVVTLVDARKLADTRYTNHLTFNEQISIADIVVGNKRDLYTSGDEESLQTYVSQNLSSKAKVIFTEQGEINFADLAGKTTTLAPKADHHHHHDSDDSPLLSDVPIPETGFIKAVNEGEGFHSIGWRFSSEQIFCHDQLTSFLPEINAERLKAIFITDKGVYSYNLASGELKQMEKVLNQPAESKIEIIEAVSQDDKNEQWQTQLRECILS